MAKIYQIATVLYDVLKTVVVPSSKIDSQVLFDMFLWCFKFNIWSTLDFSKSICMMWFDKQTQRYAKDVEEKKEHSEHYNILPLYAVGVKPAIMELAEVISKESSEFAGVCIWICNWQNLAFVYILLYFMIR